MSAPSRIYQQVEAQIKHCAPELRLSSVHRLALLTLGVAAHEHGTLRGVARELTDLGLSAAQPESTARRLRRTVADPRLDGGAGLATLLAEAISWPADTPVPVVLDESSTPGGLHVLRLSLAYRSSCLPLAWAVWPHQEKLPPGEYWRQLERVLDQAAALLPAWVRVVLLADRAYDIPPLLDRLRARGWDWIIRVKARSKLVWRRADGSEQPLRDVLAGQLDQPGRRVRLSGQTFKKAGWRPVQLVGEWGHGYQEPLVVLTSLPPRWTVLGRYARRFWIEAAFRQDKSHGWDWAHSQIRDPRHQERLLLGLAWASLLVLSLGVQHAAAVLRQVRHRRGHPTHPRDSLFTLGRDRLRTGLYGTKRTRLRWRLPRLTAPSWSAEYQAAQSSQTVLP
jgi:hypothetical protein